MEYNTESDVVITLTITPTMKKNTILLIYVKENFNFEENIYPDIRINLKRTWKTLADILNVSFLLEIFYFIIFPAFFITSCVFVLHKIVRLNILSKNKEWVVVYAYYSIHIYCC